MSILGEHNQECPEGFELEMPMLVSESCEYVARNLAGFGKAEYIETTFALAMSGYLHDHPELEECLEQELKLRISTLGVHDAMYILKGYSQRESGSPDGIYKVLERHLAQLAG